MLWYCVNANSKHKLIASNIQHRQLNKVHLTASLARVCNIVHVFLRVSCLHSIMNELFETSFCCYASQLQWLKENLYLADYWNTICVWENHKCTRSWLTKSFAFLSRKTEKGVKGPSWSLLTFSKVRLDPGRRLNTPVLNVQSKMI